MATLVLSAVGAAAGGAFGGSIVGVGAAALGKAVGASVGSVIDQAVMGSGSKTVRGRRIDRFRVQTAAEGDPMARVYGRMRIPGQVIWASNFKERRKKTTSGSKGATQTVVEFSYSVSLALALCEGEVTRLGRVWADGNPFTLDRATWRFYPGSEDQTPDPLIEAVEGAGAVPAYKGVAYVVLEDLDLAEFGNRIPQFNFEVIRHVPEVGQDAPPDPFRDMRGVALVPGSGEYALATTPVTYKIEKGVTRSANVNTAGGRSDFDIAMDHLGAEMPGVSSASLVVSWFGTDLRCSRCDIRPAVEQTVVDGTPMPWVVSGEVRTGAPVVSLTDGRPSYGGTPADASVLESIARLKADGRRVMFYPFILMDVPAGNVLDDPWTGAVGQPAFPWRGRITLDAAPNRPGSTDKTAAAAAEVAAFFGTASPTDFTAADATIAYSGPAEWSYRRFILHYASLCALAGGVDAFCIGSEMRSLTTIRDSATGYPAVAALVQLAADVRTILPGAKIGYAADWSEYFGHQPGDGSGDLLFHLDPLWGSPDIDFIGIDNYMPLSDWRDVVEHADRPFGTIYNLDYLTGNVAGGEGYDWYYASAEDRESQSRTPITDTAYGEDWVFRYKDILNWWRSPHHNRPGGIRDAIATEWVPESKPIFFTELGCGAVDKGTNQPNVFIDPKSSESFYPYFSTGVGDPFIQYRYFQAHLKFWSDPQNNPTSAVYDGPMVDMDEAHIWAWDTRPWPEFPARADIWSDGGNYRLGHWISGRTSPAILSGIAADLAEASAVSTYDVSELHGLVSGYVVAGPESARASLEPIMLSHAFDAVETGQSLAFRSRTGPEILSVDVDDVLENTDGADVERTIAPEDERLSRVQVTFYDAERDYQVGAASAAIGPDNGRDVSESDLPIAIGPSVAQNVARRWVAETDIAREGLSFALPTSRSEVTVGDVVSLEAELYRVDRITEAAGRVCEATRIEESVYWPSPGEPESIEVIAQADPTNVYAEIMDLPLLTGTEVPHAPYIAASSVPWGGTQAVYVSGTGVEFAFNTTVPTPAVVGTTLSALVAAEPGRWQRGVPLRVRVPSGELTSADRLEVLNGANAAAIRSAASSEWEVFQFEAADLVAENEYVLSGFLRGQLGTDAFVPSAHPIGADFVLLDNAIVQPDLAASTLGLLRYYKIGSASRPIDDPTYSTFEHAAAGTGLRPYAPVHLRTTQNASGDLLVEWVRRTRVGGDNWSGLDVPLGEEREQYQISFTDGAGVLLRTEDVSEPRFQYTAAAQAADGNHSNFDVAVSQLSDQFGAGPSARISVNV